MVPDIAERLTTILGSLLDVVLPAIDPHSSAAQEQAHLTVASLRMVIQQIDYAHAFEVTDCRALISLVREISSILEPAPATPDLSDVEALLGRPVLFTGDVRAANRRMRDIVATLVEEAAAAAGTEQFRRVTQAVLAYEDVQIRRDRAFVAGTGIDVEPETLVPIADSFALTTLDSGGAK